MGRVATHAAFNLDGSMLVNIWPGLVAVALEASRILRGRGPQRPIQEAAMGVVAVVTLHQSLVDSVPERAVELLLHFLMAAVAQLRRLLSHQELTLFCMVRRVAIDATHVVLEVGGARKITMLFAIVMTRQAACADLLCGCIFKGKNLRLVAAPIHVLLARSMAGLATMPLRPLLRVQGRNKMAGVFEALIKALRGRIFMAGFADFYAYVLGEVGRGLILGLLVFVCVLVLALFFPWFPTGSRYWHG